MVYIIKDYGKKKILEKGVGEIIERACSRVRGERVKYDEVMEREREKVKEMQKELEKVLKEGGLGLRKVELRKLGDLKNIATVVSEQGGEVFNRSEIRDAYIDVRVNPDNLSDVKVGGIKVDIKGKKR